MMEIKYMCKLGIIMVISFIGEVLNYIIPLPIPASIYGLVIMLGALMLDIIKLDYVQDIGMFLIEIMPIMFIPAVVDIMISYHPFKNILIPVIIIIVVTTTIVMVVTGVVTQWLLRYKREKVNE